jgi:hypothetical protein
MHEKDSGEVSGGAINGNKMNAGEFGCNLKWWADEKSSAIYSANSAPLRFVRFRAKSLVNY